MRTPRVSSPVRELSLHRHPAVARWLAELRRQQRRAQHSASPAVRARAELTLLREGRG